MVRSAGETVETSVPPTTTEAAPPEETEATVSSAGDRPGETEGTTTFYGNLYTAEIPAGWVQEEDEALASDGSYVENTWSSPDGDEALKIDQSPGNPAESAENIAADLRAAGETVYSVRHGVVRGGIVGSELAFRADSGLPERVDFFFTLGDDGYAALGSAYDLETADSLVGPLVGSIQPLE